MQTVMAEEASVHSTPHTPSPHVASQGPWQPGDAVTGTWRLVPDRSELTVPTPTHWTVQIISSP